ncbi:MAG: leucyl aminopeptidase [Clostridia bacterium]
MELKLLKSTKVPPTTEAVGVLLGKGQEVDFDNSVTEIINSLLEKEQFEGKEDEVLVTYIKDEDDYKKLILVGLGDLEKVKTEKVRKAVGKLVKKANELKVSELFIPTKLNDLTGDMPNELFLSETISLADYKFDKYLSDKKDKHLKTISLVGENEEALIEGQTLAYATNIARDLTGTPANDLTPAILADKVKELAKENGFDVDVYDEKKIQKLGMEAFWQVAKGSDNPPRLIVMRYFGDKGNDDITALVGKGITYDSGGLSLKKSDGMSTMKTDMGGSAAVIGAMSAIAKQKLNVNVVSVVAACENIPSSKSYHPGDIIGSMAGKTIHVKSTDAEGRLTLADAVYYAAEKENATRVLDIATLTGSCIVALGERVTAVLANDDDFYQRLESSSKLSDERIWRLPMFDIYKEAYKHPEADLNNVGEGGAGTITAGMFIGEFTKDLPWIHMDIAGKTYVKKDLEYIAKGPTGVGVRTLYYLAKSYVK